MSRYFDFYDPLERRYLFNSFLVVAALVEVLILLFTLIWQMDEGILGGPVTVVPFPWRQYLLASFTAPIVLVFLFGIIVKGFEFINQEETKGEVPVRHRHLGYLLGAPALLALVIVLFGGRSVWSLVIGAIKSLGLGGAYLLIALLSLGLLYFPLRLWLRYRLQRKNLEYQYLLTLAERYGVIIVDPKLKSPPEAAALDSRQAADPDLALPPPDSREK